MKKTPLILSLITLTLLFAYAGVDHFYFAPPKIAYIDSSKLIIGFSEAAKVEKTIKGENEKWQKQLKELEDSLQASVTTMTKEYNGAKAARKKELQDMLSARNQEINNFRQANMRNIEKMQKSEMTAIYSKANLYIAEYGKKHHYSIIFGTASGGSIMYANDQAFDITEQIIKGLNERYK